MSGYRRDESPVYNPNNIVVGQRLQYRGYRGTVGYVGKINSYRGTWLGVDWDDPTRGHHNGSLEGRTYFATRFSTSGSFIRADKPDIEVGVSIVEAIRNKYGSMEKTQDVEENLAMARKAMKAPFVEMVGLEKVNREQSQFENLRRVTLDNSGVNGAGHLNELKEMCPNIEELCLSRCLLRSWKSVAEITSQLHRLKVLDITDNRLTLPNIPEDHVDAFRSVEHIIAAKLDYTWTEILLCARMWPYIKKLQVPYNRFQNLIIPPANVLSQLILLDLDGNPVLSWVEINKLGNLPCLEELHLSNMRITEIFFPTEKPDEKSDLFQALNTLLLHNNRINSWQSICELDKLQHLVNLKISNNPLFEKEAPATNRQLVIARIGNLKRLNAMDIDPIERKGAEYDYVKKYANIWVQLQQGGDKEELNIFLKENSRFPSLIKVYGLPEEGELKVVSTSLRSEIISVQLLNPHDPAQSFTKKLPKSMTVQSLQGLAQKLFGTGSTFTSLGYISSKNPGAEIPLDSEFQTLHFFSVEDGDKISVRW